MKISTLSLLLIVEFFSFQAWAQDCYRQQRVEYTMKVNLNTTLHRLTGSQQLVYYNHSADTLHRVYYHLYLNAFRPGSMMDVRSRTIADPDTRVRDRIYSLKENEIGYQRVISLTQDGSPVVYTEQGTVLEVTLRKPILPNAKTTFQMEFEAQVPLQIRRTGRDNSEGVAYSMTQWYPKIAEYNAQGWHAYPYVGREFFGVWGDFDVTLTLDAKFMVAATGTLQNADEIGYGYQQMNTARPTSKRPKGPQTTWHFIAKDVHDFAWAADPEYVHTRVQVPDGPELHFFYQPSPKTTPYWERMMPYAVNHFSYMNKTYGTYPYPSYSIIQGGDGGMEYPMCTLIVGQVESEEGFQSLVGTMAHEVSHSWFQGALASNESLYPWMDEGFTTFVSNESMAKLFNQANMGGKGSYMGYLQLVRKAIQEPLSTPSDRYQYNQTYGIEAYSMGSLLLQQLRYLVGKPAFYAGMRRYYNEWKMRHPEPNDFIRVMEKASDLQLHPYFYDWVYSTKNIDYSVDSVYNANGIGVVKISRLGGIPMPLDVRITYTDGKQAWFYIPLNELMGNKPAEDNQADRTVLKTWNWVEPSYTFSTASYSSATIQKVEIDPDRGMADINLSNNQLEYPRK